MVDRKNLPDHESLNRRVRATPQNQFVEFTEKQLLYLKARNSQCGRGGIVSAVSRETNHKRISNAVAFEHVLLFVA